MLEGEYQVSALERTFAVGVNPKPGFKDPASQVVVVKARSVFGAKRAAWKKMAVGRYNKRSYIMWEYHVNEVG